jgi:hypothetical protein
MSQSAATELAEKHGIADIAGLAEALNWAGLFYDGARDWEGLGEDAPDSLDKLAKPINIVLSVLDKNINQIRLIQRLAGPSGADGSTPDRIERIDEISRRLHEMMEFLDEVRLAARDAHRPAQGPLRPPMALWPVFGSRNSAPIILPRIGPTSGSWNP